MRYRWGRLSAITVTAVAGIYAGYVGLTADLGPLVVMACGAFGLAGIAATGALLAFSYVWIEDEVRPALRFRKPVVALSLAHSEAALVGRRRFRNHPVRFWGGLTISNRFFVGFMLFDQPEHIDLLDDRDSDTRRMAETVKQGSVRSTGGAGRKASHKN